MYLKCYLCSSLLFLEISERDSIKPFETFQTIWWKSIDKSSLFSVLWKNFRCMGIVPTCMSIHYLDVWCLIRPEEGIESLELELQLHMGAGTKPVSSGTEEQPVFLTTVPSFQPILSTFYAVNYFVWCCVFLSLKNTLFWIMCMWGVWVPMSTGLLEARRGTLISWRWSYW